VPDFDVSAGPFLVVVLVEVVFGDGRRAISRKRRAAPVVAYLCSLQSRRPERSRKPDDYRFRA